jgi:hypothetical protein
MEVLWDNPDPEIRVLSAMLTILEKGQCEGLDPEALHRITEYISARFPAPLF